MFCARDEFVDRKMSSVSFVNGEHFWQRHFVKLPHHFPGISQSNLTSACRTLYGSRRTEAFSFCRLTRHLAPEKACVLSQPNIFIVALLIFIIIFQVYVQFHCEIILSLGWASFSAKTGTSCLSFFIQLQAGRARTGWCLETLPWWKIQGAALFVHCTFIYVLCISLAAVTSTAEYPLLVCHRNCHTFVVWLLRTDWRGMGGESLWTELFVWCLLEPDS